MKKIKEILKDRKKTHGDFIIQAEIAQSFKSIVKLYAIKTNLSHSQAEAIDMILHKIARIISGTPNFIDHWADISGYATLIINELNKKENKNESI